MPNGRETYAVLVDAVLRKLEAGVMPWRRPWVVARPTNLFTRRPYSGINVLSLMHAADERGYRSSSWLTAKQALARGGRILANELERPVHIAMMRVVSFPVTSKRGESVTARRLIGRSFPVYNLEQTWGLGRLERAAPTLELWNHQCQRLVENWAERPRVVTDPARAFYRVREDEIGIPEPAQFTSSTAYYATLFHELIHATGHPSRLARPELVDPPHRFGSAAYAFEELVAELGSAFLCSEAGIGNIGLQDNAAYIDSWMRVLARDPRKLLLAAYLAERACDLVMGRLADPKQEQPEAAAPVDEPSSPERASFREGIVGKAAA